MIFAFCHPHLTIGAVYESPSLSLSLDGVGSLLLNSLVLFDADDDATPDTKLLKLIGEIVLPVSIHLQLLSLPSEPLINDKELVIRYDASVQAFNSHEEILSKV